MAAPKSKLAPILLFAALGLGVGFLLAVVTVIGTLAYAVGQSASASVPGVVDVHVDPDGSFELSTLPGTALIPFILAGLGALAGVARAAFAR